MYDLIGDLHGCYHELMALLAKLGYPRTDRQAVFLGDFADRGPHSDLVLLKVREMCLAGEALAILGNHDDKLLRWLKGNKVRIGNGLNLTVQQLAPYDQEIREQLRKWLASLPWRLTLDEGRLVAVHAAASERDQLSTGDGSRQHALYGFTTEARDEQGFRIRQNWAEAYRGSAIVVHGHVAAREVRIQNGVYAIDTACVYGNKLTALRYPEMALVHVKAQGAYYFDRKLTPERWHKRS